MKYRYRQDLPKKSLSTDKIIFLIIGGLTFLALVLIFIFSVSEQKQINGAVKIASYNTNDQAKPEAAADSTFSDLGSMKVNEEKAAQFTIENKGNKPLQLFKVSSSCGCTVGIITIDGIISPEFGMHNNSNWSGEILPGKTASLSVIYRPYIMPVKGPVTRDVFVTTNDPENKLLTFTVKADVE